MNGGGALNHLTLLFCVCIYITSRLFCDFAHAQYRSCISTTNSYCKEVIATIMMAIVNNDIKNNLFLDKFLDRASLLREAERPYSLPNN